MVVSLYASILALIYICLSALVIKGRRQEKTALGSGGSKMLEQRIRAHANFAEYTPIFLILFFLAESQNTSLYIIHGVATIFTIGRILHVYALVLSEKYEGDKLLKSPTYRINAMVCTFTAIIICIKLNMIAFFAN